MKPFIIILGYGLVMVLIFFVILGHDLVMVGSIWVMVGSWLGQGLVILGHGEVIFFILGHGLVMVVYFFVIIFVFIAGI